MAPHHVSAIHTPTDSSESDRASPPLLQREVEPIAIVGMACRLPGEVHSSSELWDLLVAKKDGRCKVPSSRFNVDAFYHPKGVDRPGSMNTKGGYFLQEDVREFDNAFFGINNMEATYMDPQQRKLLEVVFECFESAGTSLSAVSGSNTGCYVGNFTVDYQVMQTRDPEYMHRYSATGMGTTILGNRISHAFNLQGPSMVIDTACSSSLYCLHTACVALENQECTAAVVAGANLIQSPEQHLGTMKAGVLSGTSTCHTFSDDADGYGRADGIGALYLKRLSDAIRDNDPIRAVIRSTAINANGKTPGITLPSADGQQAVIRKAYAKAGLDLDGTAYVECHGTGTPVGDPIEVAAVSRVFQRPKDSPLLIGSVKTNLGHSEAASGISSVIKTVLALEKSTIPATIGVRNINPKIKTAEWNLEVVTSQQPWPKMGGTAASRYLLAPPTRRAGINSFGYGGANAHCILENAGPHVPYGYGEIVLSPGQKDKTFLLPVSAADSKALEARVIDIAPYVKTGVNITDLAYTLGVRRSHFNHRGFLTVKQSTIGDAWKLSNLRALPEGIVPPNSPSQLAFVFTGQGAQWPQMCKELFEEYEFFRACITEMDRVLQSLPHPPSWTLYDAINEPAATSMVHHVTRSQPTCTAIQVAMVQLLASWGISPSATVGHSSGEIAAAFAAGLLSVAEAITIAYYRGYVVGKSTLQGSMIAVGASHEHADYEIRDSGLETYINVACVNSPESVTLSGDATAIDTILEKFQKQGLFARKLNTGGRAYHSHHMKAIGAEYEALLEQALSTLDIERTMPTDATFISSVTGKIQNSNVRPAYWRANLENAVLFSTAIEQLSGTGDYHLVELGPHSALEMPIKQIRTKIGLADDKLPYSTAMTRGKDGVQCILGLAGRLYCYGIEIPFNKINSMDGSPFKERHRVLSDLPRYLWTYDGILWNESRASIEFRQRKYPRHELLGSQIPGGNGFESNWRNIIKVADISWLSDHKLEETIVFPAAGYVAMAIEAVTQTGQPILGKERVYRVRNVNIVKALSLSKEPSDQIELFTTLRPATITSSSVSSHWWDFRIVSFSNGISTTHATGSISLQSTSKSSLSRKFSIAQEVLEPSAPRIWYEKLYKEGLNFGRAFQSVTDVRVPRDKNTQFCTTKVALLQNWEESSEYGPNYVLHPITIDAMLQTSIIATTAGITSSLRAKVPVMIDSALFHATINNTLDDSWFIDAEAFAVGFGAARINAELYDGAGRVKAQVKNVRLAAYDAARHKDPAEKRHPMLRVLWKPDIHGIGLIPEDRFATYLDNFVAESHSEVSDEGLLKLGATLTLLSHKNPGLRILELANDIPEITQAALDLLHANTSFRRFGSYSKGFISDYGELFAAAVDFETGLPKDPDSLPNVSNESYDLILLPNIGLTDMYMGTRLAAMKDLMAPRGLFLALSSSVGYLHSAENGFDAIQSNLKGYQGRVIFSHLFRDNEFVNNTKDGRIVIVDSDINSLGLALQNKLSELAGSTIQRFLLHEVSEQNIPRGTTVFSLLESEKPLLAGITDDQMKLLKIITDNASNLVWITAGDLLKGGDPNYSLVSGLSRALMLEQPSLKFFTYDVDNIDHQPQTTANNIASILAQPRDSDLEFEFIQAGNVVHISRFVPDDSLNDSFRQKQGAEIVNTPLDQAKPAQISIERLGQFDTIFFARTPTKETLQPNEVQVEVKAVGLNAKDFYVLGGKVDTRDSTCALEFCGLIERVGSAVTKLKQGDRVVVMAPSHFKTNEIIPEWACQKLQDNEEFNLMSTLPVVYATSIYALNHRAQLKSGETVLIHAGAGGVGIAAIQIAKLAGAKIYTTVSTEAKKQFLVETFGIDPNNIFSSRDESFLPALLQATNGRGVDVILNSLTGDLLHASWRCCAPFGRFIEIGKRDLTDCGRLEMEQFLKNATFSAFDMSNLFYSEKQEHQKVWADLISEVLQLYRENKIAKIEPLEVFDVSNVTQAMRHFSSRNRMGKIAISLEDPKSILKLRPYKFNTILSANKTYIMVGCLGGLGRSISKWMLSRGARKFVFLGRTGLDRPAARRLVEDLESRGAHCDVVQGNVCNEVDVLEAVKRVKGNIGGVVQAAMGLNEALFTTMTNHFWHTGIDPKVIGTWNLHHAIKGKDSELDFFLMTSSISGSVGTATESNYCAGNHFLDAFARHRHSLGLPATAVGLGMISEVGYLHENPEIEALLIRKGIQAINEDELLQIIDVSLSNDTFIPHAYDSLAQSHILTGLEPLGLIELRKKGFEGTNPTLKDPRASILARALDGETDLALKGQEGNLPAEVVKAMESGTSLGDAILLHISKRFSNLILVPLDKVDVTKPLAAYGMDSMIAAEFRTWFFQAFEVDIPFLELLSKSVTVAALTAIVVTEVGKSAAT